ncbi:sterol regulatory element-binding protein cleavage-activating protein isoform X2 [Neocloeon triangulifer]|uniref:sterol regulatory element-binding protein cleavage-activating protein isoform X2 n=1 Tax=Neocloeon triangulifer TaxID=2078957 RepID=UPI00286F7389|nr:sterol regulatory element-binding protein cleavage-activating protein isoform X2 [Neocloeon triangulifer]
MNNLASESSSATAAAPKRGLAAGLPDRVAQLYYSHGLFIASHPYTVVIFAVAIILACCYPLTSIPLPGNVPQQYRTFVSNHTHQNQTGHFDVPPRWFSNSPLCYVQQVVVKSAVVPWSNELILTDAFRAPLEGVFHIIEAIQNYQNHANQMLGNLCLHIEAVKEKIGGKIKFPEYNCLVLSPANLWQNNRASFQDDANILGTIFSHQNLQKGKVSLPEMLFGMNMQDTGIKRYPLRSRQRFLQYAVTIVFQDYDQQFIDGLKEMLMGIYPLYSQNLSSARPQEIWHIYYPGEINYREFVPLLVTYAALFFYVYFSLRKMDFVKSKVGIAFSAVITVASSLAMAVGLCFFFGLRLSLDGKEVFPYVVVAVGLENVLILTKSIISTQAHLDVKIRVAQGLSKEGWNITKNLLTEVTILTIGLLTFVPAIQEFCIFAVVGLIADFFLHMFFYSAVLAIDIRRSELSEPALKSLQRQPYDLDLSSGSRLSRSKSHPRLSTAGLYPTNIVAFSPQNPSAAGKSASVPKRLRLVHFWTRTRIFQRAFMICMVVWIGMIAYNAQLVQKLAEVNRNGTAKNSAKTSSGSRTKANSGAPSQTNNLSPIMMNLSSWESQHMDDLLKLVHSGLGPWRMLSQHHWASILRLYNISTAGHYLSILPPITVSVAVSPEQAKILRNPNEKGVPVQSQWQALAAALDPLDFAGAQGNIDAMSVDSQPSMSEVPYVPQSPMELFLTAVLCIISVLVVAYFLIVLYRCVCTRNYAEWRTSWASGESVCSDSSTQVVLESMPVVLEGHPQQIECLTTDGSVVASTCLSGEVRSWNVFSGECMAVINRRRFFCTPLKPRYASDQDLDDLPYSDYESGSPPSQGRRSNSNLYNLDNEDSRYVLNKENLPHQSARNSGDLDWYQIRDSTSNLYSKTEIPGSININFTSSKSTDTMASSPSGYDFGRYHSFEEERPTGMHHISNEAEVVTPENVHLEPPLASTLEPPPIWCIDCQSNQIVIGCANGRLELWEATTGKFKCLMEDPNGIGSTSLKIIGNRVVVAKLNGCIDFLEIDSYRKGKRDSWGFSSFRRTHIRTGSAGSMDWEASVSGGISEEVCFQKLATVRAHQQPITVLDSEGARVLSGSQDHTLRVYRLEDQLPLFTLHGHCGPITALFIDKISPMMSGSGSQDGMLCVWDLLTGACMYSIQAHDGSIQSLAYSASYVLSLGVDDKLCVWERFQGHLLNTISIPQSYCCSMVMLTHNLLITSKQDSLLVWDVRRGEPIRAVRLGVAASTGVFVQHLITVHDSVVCDYGSQLRVVRFPLVSDSKTTD